MAGIQALKYTVLYILFIKYLDIFTFHWIDNCMVIGFVFVIFVSFCFVLFCLCSFFSLHFISFPWYYMHVFQAVLQLMILLLLPPKSCDERCIPPHPARFGLAFHSHSTEFIYLQRPGLLTIVLWPMFFKCSVKCSLKLLDPKLRF